MGVRGLRGRAAAAVLAATALVAGLSACGIDEADGTFISDDVVVGSATETDLQIVGQIYAAALRSTGIRVETDLAVGDRADALRALDSGRVSLVPDYSGALLEYYQPLTGDGAAPGSAAEVSGGDGEVGDPRAETVDPTHTALARALPEHLRIGDAALAERRDTVAVTAQTAEQLAEPTLSAFADRCAETVLGLDAGFLAPDYTLAALADGYRCDFADQRWLTSAEEVRTALEDGEIGAAGMHRRSPDGPGTGIVLLGDDKDLLPAQYLVPVFRSTKLGDEQVRALNTVAGELTTADLIEMVAEVDSGRSTVAAIVAAWLPAHGF